MKQINFNILMCFSTLFFLICNPVQALDVSEIEDEPVSLKEFKASQKKQKIKKYPIILASSVFVMNSKKFIGKQYQIMIMGDGMANMSYFSKLIGRECQFTYYYNFDIGFGKKTGSGNYYFVVPKKDCAQFNDIADSNISTAHVMVEFEKIVQIVNSAGQTLSLPVFKVIKKL